MSPEMLSLVASELADTDTTAGHTRVARSSSSFASPARRPGGHPATSGTWCARSACWQLVLTVGLDREAVEVYLASAGLEVLGEADEVAGRGPDGASVTVRFDRLGRIRDVRTTLEPKA